MGDQAGSTQFRIVQRQEAAQADRRKYMLVEEYAWMEECMWLEECKEYIYHPACTRMFIPDRISI